MSMVRYTLVLFALLTIVGCNELQGKRPPRAATEPKSIVNTDDNGVALQGYDPVAFFTDHKPVKGESDIHSTYKLATYYFASQDHQKLFDSDPAKYEPQFGGYCGYAASIDKISPISVDYWEIIDGSSFSTTRKPGTSGTRIAPATS